MPPCSVPLDSISHHPIPPYYVPPIPSLLALFILTMFHLPLSLLIPSLLTLFSSLKSLIILLHGLLALTLFAGLLLLGVVPFHSSGSLGFLLLLVRNI